MGVHIYLQMRKVLQPTISYVEFIGIPTNNKFYKEVRCIHDNKLWGRCYVILRILFPCLRVLCLVDSNRAGMDKFYYYSIMTRKFIDNTISDIDYHKLFPDLSSPTNAWNKLDEKGKKKI